MVISRPSVMFDSSVYSPINQCKATGLEKEIYCLSFPNGEETIRVFKDNFGRHRITLFLSSVNEYVSGVLLSPEGEITYKETNTQHRGKNYTRQLQACLTLFNIKWHPCQYQTTEGRMCYKH